ncbi:MAG: hypothetical protein IJ204_00495 [Paludibacteraceae bacterium]|nr:hypothetical protein [Paludibacteraceae bacterium]
MEEVIKYFEGLEERIATLEAELASLEAEIDELKSRPAPEPQVVEKVVEKIVEKPVEVIKEVVVEKPVVVAAPIVQEEPEKPEEPKAIQEEPAAEEPVKEEPVKEEPMQEEPAKEEAEVEEIASPKAAIYGKAVDDIRQAISLGDRFLYQRELFGQNAELMQRTLDELNKLGSYDEAVAYISNRFQWDIESNTYQQFLVTLHRRFG